MQKDIYFNDNERYVTEWLRNLWPDSTVDDRSIEEVNASTVLDYERCHFFAGIGGWELALDMANWPRHRPIWTASLPCQPFSTAGKRKGESDERHLWPVFRRLIEQCQPPTIFGEQVASKDGRAWLTGVRTDLETLGYEFGAADLCAASIGAPHIRQRLYWVANAPGLRRQQQRSGQGIEVQRECSQRTGQQSESECLGELPRGLKGLCSVSGLADSKCELSERSIRLGGEARSAENSTQERQRVRPDVGDGDSTVRLGDTNNDGPQGLILRGDGSREWFTRQAGMGAWGTYNLVECRDGKTRRFEPSSFPLAHGVSSRVGRIRAYGNSIVPPLAAEFISSFLEATRY